MFFVRVGSIIAWLLVIFGTLRTLMGFLIAFEFDGEANAQASREYLAAANSGEAINEGMLYFVAGILIGLLVRIAKLLHAQSEQ